MSRDGFPGAPVRYPNEFPEELETRLRRRDSAADRIPLSGSLRLNTIQLGRPDPPPPLQESHPPLPFCQTIGFPRVRASQTNSSAGVRKHSTLVCCPDDITSGSAPVG